MLEDIVTEPMTENMILWRCLHSGPLSNETIDQLPPNQRDEWNLHRAINIPLLKKIITTYGTCAILARDGDHIIGFLRFYPKILYSLKGTGGLCLQQIYPAGPSRRLIETRLPPIQEIHEKTLTVHCMMTGSPFQDENPYQRKGIGTQMACELIRWAKEKGWTAIEATAYEDLDVLYAQTGHAGKRFWKKLGFHVIKTDKGSGFTGEFWITMQKQALEKGLNPEVANNRFTMRFDLT